ncbi:MAG: hypothetical protein L0215_21955 [Gemmataceae bacterium]|nr:hypothetical protein [Gemmataceae bacterium]
MRKVLQHTAVCLATLWLATPAARATHKPAPVPPTLEIEVLDPNAHPLGAPAAVPNQVCPDLMKIDIPPTVIVHKFYYTGDRTFQSRFLPGGPSIVVANHPKTGERQYISVQMLPGAPRIKYTHRCIEYDFGNNGIIIEFCWLTCKHKVSYRNCPTVASKVGKIAAKVKETAKDVAARTGIAEATVQFKETAKDVTETALDQVGTVGRTLMIPLQRLSELIPGSQVLTSSPEDRATNLRDAKLRAADFQKQFKNLSIPTNQ